MSALDMACEPLLGDDELDLDFFNGVFDDLPTADDLFAATVEASADVPVGKPPPSSLVVTIRSDRRRQRWRTDHESDPSERVLGWRQIAKSQKQQREAAEKENAKLRKLIAGHVRATEKILKLTRRASSLASREIVVVSQTTLDRGIQYRGPPADLDQLTLELDALAREADSLFRPFGQNAATKAHMSGHSNRIVKTATGSAVEATVEMAWVLPFDVESITKMLMTHSIRLVTKGKLQVCTTVYDDSQLSIVRAVGAEKEKKGFWVTKHGQLTTRRERPRADGSNLLVMISRGAIFVDSTKVVSIEGDSAILVSSVPGHDSDRLGPLSSIQWTRLFRAQPIADAGMSPAEQAQWLHGFSAGSERRTERQMDKISQAMENLLLVSPPHK